MNGKGIRVKTNQCIHCYSLLDEYYNNSKARFICDDCFEEEETRIERYHTNLEWFKEQTNEGKFKYLFDLIFNLTQ